METQQTEQPTLFALRPRTKAGPNCDLRCFCCGGHSRREEASGIGVGTFDVCDLCSGARIVQHDDGVWVLDCPTHGIVSTLGHAGGSSDADQHVAGRNP